jgi:hypothetical protein
MSVAMDLANKLAEMTDEEFEEFHRSVKDSDMYKLVKEAGFIFPEGTD